MAFVKINPGLASQRPGAGRGCGRRAKWRCCAAAPERNVTRTDDALEISRNVESLYDAYPYPPEPLHADEPGGYNWRWHYPTAYGFSTHRAPPTEDIRILDAGCGTGCGTEYLVHLNQKAEVVGIDLSEGAINVAKERLALSVPTGLKRTQLVQKSIYDVGEIEGEFDFINCVGVLHHTPDPLRALRALESKLKPGGIIHVFIYALHGRWEIQLMQRALAILQKGQVDFERGVKLGRRVFSALPDNNRLRLREEQRWALDNRQDATFADMYLHPQEIDYTVEDVFKLVDQTDLKFAGFSNPHIFDLSRVLGSDPELLKEATALDDREQYRLIELLDPESVTHFEFFLAKEPYARLEWSDAELRRATATLSPCITGFELGNPSTTIMDRDYSLFNLTGGQQAFLVQIAENPSVGAAMDAVAVTGDEVRHLIRHTVILPLPAE